MRKSDAELRKLKRRKSLAVSLGLQQGTLYARHREKFQYSAGYVRDGNLRHFVACNCKRPIHVKGNRALR